MSVLLQGQVSFTASADTKQVVSTGYFKVTYTLSNADGSSFQPPNFKKNFEILSGPAQRTNTTIINGKVDKKISLTYELRPKSVGKFTIAPAVIYANGNKLTSNSISIEVVKGKAQSTNGDDRPIDEKVFVRVEVDTANAFIGQQLMVDYKLFTTINVAGYNLLSESEYDGCFVQNVRTFNNRQQREIVDGVQYVTQVLKRVSIFPQQTGLIAIEPANVQLNISTGRRSNSFFRRNETKAHYTKTNLLEINVKTLPEDAPTNFTGGVGKFKISAQHSDSRVTTDDGVSIKFSIIGDGDMKRVSAPIITSPLASDGSAAFEIYEPTLKNDASYENGGKIEGRKDYEYLLLPKATGSYIINPQFTYFDTDSSKFVTNTTYKFPIVVSQGRGVPSDKTLTEQSISKDQLKPYIANVPLNGPVTYIVQQPWYWVLFGLPIVGFLGLVGYQQYEASREQEDPEVVARRKAEKVARQKLAQAEQFMQSSDAGAFYKEISTAYLGYVQDKLSIKTADLSRANVAAHLADLHVSKAKIEEFVGVMNKTDMALYSGGASTDAMQQFYNSAVEVLVGVEREISAT